MFRQDDGIVDALAFPFSLFSLWHTSQPIEIGMMTSWPCPCGLREIFQFESGRGHLNRIFLGMKIIVQESCVISKIIVPRVQEERAFMFMKRLDCFWTGFVIMIERSRSIKRWWGIRVRRFRSWFITTILVKMELWTVLWLQYGERWKKNRDKRKKGKVKMWWSQW